MPYIGLLPTTKELPLETLSRPVALAGNHCRSGRTGLYCAGDTTDMNICAFQDYQRADAKLNAAYKKRVASLEKAQLERLRTAQRAWIAFRDAQCRYEAGVYEGDQWRPWSTAVVSPS